MLKYIVIHANCLNSCAKGDYVFAANIAKDLKKEIRKHELYEIDVILVSEDIGINHLKSLYKPLGKNRIDVAGETIGFYSLQDYYPLEKEVIAFIDANRCKVSPREMVKRLISPETKFLFIGNVNQRLPYGSLSAICVEQPGIYESFNKDDFLFAVAGLGLNRLGIPTINKVEELSPLTSVEMKYMPNTPYGFMYLSNIGHKSILLIAQYMKITCFNHYVLTGDFLGREREIEEAYQFLKLPSERTTFPNLTFHHSLPNTVMRNLVSNTSDSLVLSTGTTSTLEVMRDGKLPFYQTLLNNVEFIQTYLIAVHSIIAEDSSLFGNMPELIMNLSCLLFSPKPLNKNMMEETQRLLKIDSVTMRLQQINTTIIEKANGTLAPRLLSFITDHRHTSDDVQLKHVFARLRKAGESENPPLGLALRRAAAFGLIFELKTLIRQSCADNLQEVDKDYERTPLHWAVFKENIDCARALIKAKSDLHVLDKNGKSPLQLAKEGKNIKLIMILEEAEKQQATCANPMVSFKVINLSVMLSLFASTRENSLLSNKNDYYFFPFSKP